MILNLEKWQIVALQLIAKRMRMRRVGNRIQGKVYDCARTILVPCDIQVDTLPLRDPSG